MAKFLLSARRILLSPSPTRPSKLFSLHSLCSETFRSIEDINSSSTPTNHRRQLIQLPPMIPTGGNHLEKGFHIELVDSDLWGVSFGLAHPWNGTDGKPEASNPSLELVHDGSSDCSPVVVEEDTPDFDEIEDLRLRKKLFYKLDKGSKEFEENNFSFHRRKSSKKKKTREKLTQADRKKECKKSEKKMDDTRVSKQKAKNSNKESERARIEAPVMEGKKVRTPTFNQLTDPYHLPFCLDIYISKGSVRACVVHRVTSKVVAVAHSISKDMKFDLTSKKDAKACAAVGQVLAKRAIEDDIYNVVYTPRKGENIEGKIQIVLQSIIDHGVDVKVKLKQKRPKK
nr:uncharacterized protein LOC105034569 isoform X2 [Elaeis guineensis]